MLEHIKQNQYVYFSIVAHHPSGGYLSATDTQPTYTVRKKVGNTITNLISNYDMQTSMYPDFMMVIFILRVIFSLTEIIVKYTLLVKFQV